MAKPSKKRKEDAVQSAHRVMMTVIDLSSRPAPVLKPKKRKPGQR